MLKHLQHPTDKTIEIFASGGLNDRALRRVEVHLLLCPACRARIAVEDSIRELFRIGMAQPEWMDTDQAQTGTRTVARTAPQVESPAAEVTALVPRLFHFRTHLPIYSLAAAAGAFDAQQDGIDPEGWVAVRSSPVLLTRDMFVTHIKGNSMEPVIPDGTLCAFRSHVTIPCEGKIVLVEDYSEAGGNRYSVKRYHASTQADPHRKDDPAWLHERITLESINPQYGPLEIPSARKVNIIGEFAFIVSYRKAGTPGGRKQVRPRSGTQFSEAGSA